MPGAVVEQKLESLRRCVLRVEAKIPGTLSELVSDLDAQDIVALNLTRAVQICIDIGAGCALPVTALLLYYRAPVSQGVAKRSVAFHSRPTHKNQ